MAVNRAGIVDHNLTERSRSQAPARTDPDAPVRADTSPSAREALALFQTQVESRDAAARALQARNGCSYTIGSSGHESDAAVAARADDPAFLHPRRGGAAVAPVQGR